MPDGQGNVRVGNAPESLRIRIETLWGFGYRLSPQDRDRLRNWGGEGAEENTLSTEGAMR